MIVKRLHVEYEVVLRRGGARKSATHTNLLRVGRHHGRDQSRRNLHRRSGQIDGVRNSQVEIERQPSGIPGRNDEVMRVIELYCDGHRARERITVGVDRLQGNTLPRTVVGSDARVGVVECQSRADVVGRRNLPRADHFREIHELREVDLSRHRQRLDRRPVRRL